MERKSAGIIESASLTSPIRLKLLEPLLTLLVEASHIRRFAALAV